MQTKTHRATQATTDQLRPAFRNVARDVIRWHPVQPSCFIIHVLNDRTVVAEEQVFDFDRISARSCAVIAQGTARLVAVLLFDDSQAGLRFIEGQFERVTRDEGFILSDKQVIWTAQDLPLDGLDGSAD